MKHATQWDTTNYPNDPSDDRIQGDEWNQRHVLTIEAEPDDPDENESLMWMSNGEGQGAIGDLLVKCNVAGVVVTINLTDYSSSSLKSTAYAESFSSADLTGTQKTVTHNLGTKYFSAFTVFDDSDVPVSGVTLVPIDENSATLDVAGFTVNNDWVIVVSPGNSDFVKTGDEVTFGGDSVTFGGEEVTW